jgi:hypothetical protein
MPTPRWLGLYRNAEIRIEEIDGWYWSVAIYDPRHLPSPWSRFMSLTLDGAKRDATAMIEKRSVPEPNKPDSQDWRDFSNESDKVWQEWKTKDTQYPFPGFLTRER